MVSYDSLPPEIWILVVEAAHLIDPTTLRNPTIESLSLTSRIFYIFAQPYIHHRLSITNGTASGIDKGHQIFDFFLGRPERCQWIKHLTINGQRPREWDHDPSAPDLSSYLPRLRQFVMQLKDIGGLKISGMNISPVAYTHLIQLPSLEEIELFDLNFPKHASVKVEPRTLKLKRVMLRGPFNGPDLSMEDTVAVSKFLLSPVLEELYHLYAPVPVMHIFSDLYPNHHFQRLRVLGMPASTSDDGHDLLLQFLRHCPNLENLQLHLPVLVPEQVKDRPFPSDVLSKLQHYSGPVNILNGVLSGRPVRKVEIGEAAHPYLFTRDNFLSLCKCSVAVTSLHLESRLWEEENLTHIADLLPKLEELVLWATRGDYKPWLPSLMVRVDNLVHLRKLDLGWPKRDRDGTLDDRWDTTVSVEAQLVLLKEFCVNKPSLKEVKLDPRTRWIRKMDGWVPTPETYETYFSDLGVTGQIVIA